MTSSGVEAVELAASVGVHLDPWQQLFMVDCLGERADGRWSAREAGLLVARQNGKGEILLCLGLAGLFLLDERLIMHSAHEFKTAAEAFLRIKTVIDGSDDLRRQVKTIRTSHGEEGVELTDGRRLRFVARSKSSGRGFTGDRIILDEAQQLPMRAVRALIPTLRARPNPQIVYTGTVPSAENDAEQWEAVRDRGRAGSDPRLLWHEYSPPGSEDSQVDPDDRDNWYWSNPALGIRITEEDMSAERETFRADPEGFVAELLSGWQAGAASNVVDMLAWGQLMDPLSAPLDPAGVCFAVDMPRDRSSLSIALAARRGDGLQHVEVVECRPGSSWAPARLAELVKKWTPCAVILDAGGPAGALLPALADLGVETVNPSAREVGQAAGLFLDSVAERAVRHRGDHTLDVALLAAKKRPLGDAWTWDRRDLTDISPLVAATLALWGFAVHGGDAAPNIW